MKKKIGILCCILLLFMSFAPATPIYAKKVISIIYPRGFDSMTRTELIACDDEDYASHLSGMYNKTWPGFTEDEEDIELDVNWDFSALNIHKPGCYTVTFTLSVPEELSSEYELSGELAAYQRMIVVTDSSRFDTYVTANLPGSFVLDYLNENIVYRDIHSFYFASDVAQSEDQITSDKFLSCEDSDFISPEVGQIVIDRSQLQPDLYYYFRFTCGELASDIVCIQDNGETPQITYHEGNRDGGDVIEKPTQPPVVQEPLPMPTAVPDEATTIPTTVPEEVTTIPTAEPVVTPSDSTPATQPATTPIYIVSSEQTDSATVPSSIPVPSSAPNPSSIPVPVITQTVSGTSVTKGPQPVVTQPANSTPDDSEPVTSQPVVVQPLTPSPTAAPPVPQPSTTPAVTDSAAHPIKTPVTTIVTTDTNVKSNKDLEKADSNIQGKKDTTKANQDHDTKMIDRANVNQKPDHVVSNSDVTEHDSSLQASSESDSNAYEIVTDDYTKIYGGRIALMKEEYGDALPFCNHGITTYIPSGLLNLTTDDYVKVELTKSQDHTFTFHLFVNEEELPITQEITVFYPSNDASLDTVFYEGEKTDLPVTQEQDFLCFHIHKNGTYSLKDSHKASQTTHLSYASILPITLGCAVLLLLSGIVIVKKKRGNQ